MTPTSFDMRTRIVANVRVDESGCWIWTGQANNRGYGLISRDNSQIGAHRASYEAFVSPVPDGLTLDHLCRNAICVNPGHVEPVTNEENQRRAAAARTTCRRGHARSPENLQIGPTGRRNCRACRREINRAYRQGLKGAQS